MHTKNLPPVFSQFFHDFAMLKSTDFLLFKSSLANTQPIYKVKPGFIEAFMRIFSTNLMPNCKHPGFSELLNPKSFSAKRVKLLN